MNFVRLAAAILPLAGLAAAWAWSEQRAREGTEWEVPVEGYDPRDLLRGHYVEFTYDWPLPEPDPGEGARNVRPPPQALCLSGIPPAIAAAVPFDPLDQAALDACAHPVIADPGAVYGRAGLRTGRLYVGQDRARRIERQFFDRDMRAIVRLRQRPGGGFAPVDIRFRPPGDAERGEGAEERIEPTAPPIIRDPGTGE